MSGNVNNLLDGKFPKAPLDQVISWERDGYNFSGSARFNPDQLGGRDGMRTYKKMRLDEQVKAVMNFKRDAIFARGWTFAFDSATTLSDDEQVMRIRIANAWVDKLRGSFIDALNCVATGRDFGYSLTEKVYSAFDFDGRSIIGVSKLKGRDPTTFEFTTDEYGELVKCEQLAAGKRQTIDLRRFVHYIHNPEFDEYYGRSDLREAYKPWYWKNQMLDLMLTYGERMAGGFVTVQRDPSAQGSLSSRDRDALDAVIANLRSVTGVVLPAGYSLTVHSPASTDFFMKAVEFFDLAIARSLLVPNLLGVSHNGQTGAYAQSQTQLEAFFWTLNADKQRLQACLNEQLFRDLGDQNWGDGQYPVFEFKELSSETFRWLVQTWSTLVGAGIVVATEDDERLLRARLEMPERDEQSKLMSGKTMAEQQAEDEQQAADAANPAEDDTEDDTEDEGIVNQSRELFYNEDQPRDENGRWTDGGGGAAGKDMSGEAAVPGALSNNVAISSLAKVKGSVGSGPEPIKDGMVSLYHVTATHNLTEIDKSGVLNNELSSGNMQGYEAEVRGTYGFGSLSRAKAEIERASETNKDSVKDYAIVHLRVPVSHPGLTADEDFGGTWQESRTSGNSIAVKGGLSLKYATKLYADDLDFSRRIKKSAENDEEATESITNAVRRELSKFGFDPDQPRDENGQWTSGGGAGRPGSTGGPGKPAGSQREFNDRVAVAARKINRLPKELKGKEQKLAREALDRAKAAKSRDVANSNLLLAEKYLDLLVPSESRAKMARTRALHRVHFSVIADRHAALSHELTNKLAQQVAVAVNDLLGTPAQLATLVDTDVEDIASIAFPPARVSKLKDTIKRALGGAWMIGQQHAQNELARATAVYNRKHITEPIKHTFVSLRDNAADFFEANGFRMAGNLADGTRAILQQELQNAVKYGKSPAQARADIWARLVAKGMTTREQARGVETDEAVQEALNELWLDTEEDAAAYLNTLTRTNMFEAMNEARFAEFTDPELGDFIEGLEYSAVLDERTTEICSALNGCTLKADNAAWDNLRPPNHYNCRSLLIPITAIDGWDGVETEIPDVEPQEGFK